MPEKRLANFEVVTFATGNLGGYETSVATEDIALHADSLAPGQFGWRLYPERIDLEVVRKALRDARSNKNDALVTGSSAKGWMLTKNGMELFKSILADNDDLHDVAPKYRRGSLLLAQDAERRRILESKAYALYVAGDQDQITRRDFFDCAKINEYFTPNARRRRYDFVESAISEHDNLVNFWRFMQERFAKEFD